MISISVSQIAAKSLLREKCEIFSKKTRKEMIPANDGMPPRVLWLSLTCRMTLSLSWCLTSVSRLFLMRSIRSKKNSRSLRMNRQRSKKSKGRKSSNKSKRKGRLLKKKRKLSKNKLRCCRQPPLILLTKHQGLVKVLILRWQKKTGRKLDSSKRKRSKTWRVRKRLANPPRSQIWARNLQILHLTWQNSSDRCNLKRKKSCCWMSSQKYSKNLRHASNNWLLKLRQPLLLNL